MKGTKAVVGATGTTPQGYLIEKTADGWQLKHRLVMEEKLGRKLGPRERVYFANGNKQDCRPENLRVEVSSKRTLRSLERRREKLLEQLKEVEEAIADRT